MTYLTNNAFTAYVAIDWADAKHDICVQAAGSLQREFDCISHQVDQIEQWAQSLHKRFGGTIAIALELSKGPIVYALQKYDFFVVFPVNPSTLAKYRETFTPSGAKDDRQMRSLSWTFWSVILNASQPLNPQSVEMRTLACLVEQRRNLVDDKTRITNRLRSTLKQYYPQMLEWFKHVDTVMVLRLHYPVANAQATQTSKKEHLGKVLS